MTKESVIESLRDILKNDSDNMNPENLYNRIKNSSGSISSLSDIFEVPEYLVKFIKEGE